MSPGPALSRRAALGGLAGLALPTPGRAAPRVLRVVPHAKLVNLDPLASTAAITRDYGFMVYDTLYGMSAAMEPSPQMAEGHAMDYGGRRAVIFLRDGLNFHDGEPVRAQDVVASLRRWMARNPFGQSLAAATSSLSALDSRRVQIVLRRPYPWLFHGLAGLSQPAFILPERIAQADPPRPLRESVGSGPFRFSPEAFDPDAGVAVFERNADYIPAAGAPSLTAGGKHVYFDRVEWRAMADAAAAAALQAGEVDWYENPPPPLHAVLRRNRAIAVERMNPAPRVAVLRLNHLQPPFDKAEVRRALLPAIDQQEFMAAVTGGEPSQAFVDVGVYTPGTPSATRAGLEPLLGPRSAERARDMLTKAGALGAKVRLIGPNDVTSLDAMTQVAAETFRRCGFDVEVESADWAAILARRNSKASLDQGGWSAFVTSFSGFECYDPATNVLIRGNGEQGWAGWPTLPRLEALRDEWLNAEEAADRPRVTNEIQQVAVNDVAVIPLGAFLQPTALRRNLVDRVPGFAIFWGLRQA